MRADRRTTLSRAVLADVPFDYVREDVGLLERVIEGVVRVRAAAPKRCWQIVEASPAKRHARLDGVHRLDIEATAEAHRTRLWTEATEVPVQERPVERSRIGTYNRPVVTGGIGDPKRKITHRDSWVDARRHQSIPVQPRDLKRSGFIVFGDRAQLSVERASCRVTPLVANSVKATSDAEPQREHGVRTGDRPVGLDINRQIEIGCRTARHAR